MELSLGEYQSNSKPYSSQVGNQTKKIRNNRKMFANAWWVGKNKK